MSRTRAWQILHRPVGYLSDGPFVFVLVLGVCLGWLALHRATLDYDWNFDDYHLIRPFSATELGNAFRSTWDVDHMETDGFRPFTVWFNHTRAVLLGESLILHRLFLLALAGALLFWVGRIGLAFGLRRVHIVLILLLLMSSRSLALYIVWVADGVHVFRWAVLALAVWLLLSDIERPAPVKLVLSFALVWLALWTREDSLVMLVIMPWLVIGFCVRRVTMAASGMDRLVQLRQYLTQRIWLYFGLLYALALVTLVYRRWLLPQDNLPRVTLASAARGIVNYLYWTGLWVGDLIAPEGIVDRYQAGGAGLTELTLAWLALAGLLVGAWVGSASRESRDRIVFCGIGLGAAALPSLVLVRPNLLLLGAVFLSVALAVMVVEVWEGRAAALGPLVPRAICIATMLVAVGGGHYRASLQLTDLHPLSINQLTRDAYWLYGPGRRSHAHIPPTRLTGMRDRLCAQGLCNADTYRARLAALAATARPQRLFSPLPLTQPFIPRVEYLAP